MKKIFQYILMTIAMVAMASCSQDEVLTPSAELQDIRIVVSDFPVFDDAQTRAIGTFDSGKTAWAPNDVIYIVAANVGVDSQILTLTYGADGKWIADETTIPYVSATDTHIRAIYAPNYEKEGAEIKEKDDYPFVTGEFLEKECFVVDGTLTVDFTGYVRPYSRLRIVTGPNEQMAVTATLFDPAGYKDSGTYNYTLTADANGNAYLYGKFAAGGTVTVKNGDEVLKNYMFAAATGDAESYVIDVIGYSYDKQTNTYTVWSAKGLYAWNEALQTDLNTNLVLAADITLPNKDLATGEEITVTDGKPSGSNWNPYGYYDSNVYDYTMYNGTIDGGGYTISGMRINMDDRTGFVKVLGGSGSIRNLLIDDVVIYSTGNSVAAFAGNNYGIMENCHVKGEASSIYGQADYVGGIAGDMNNNAGDAQIIACSNMATVTRVDHVDSKYGGIVGSVSNMGYSYNLNIIGCWTKDTNENDGTKDGIGSNNGAFIEGVFSVADATAANSKISEMNQALEDAGYSYRWETKSGDWPEIKKYEE